MTPRSTKGVGSGVGGRSSSRASRSALATVLGLVLLASCAGRQRREVEEPPAWRDERQSYDVRIALIETLVDGGSTRPAMDLLATMREEGIDNPELDLLQGRALYVEGMYGEAESLLLGTLDELGKDPRPWRALGLVYADTGRVAESTEALATAVDLAPDHAATWNNYGYLLMSAGRHQEASDALRKAVALDGTVFRYRNNLGFAQAACGRYDEALQSFSTAGTPADAHANLGTALEAAGELARAVEHYQRALEYNPTHASAKESFERLQADGEEVP